MFNVKDPQAADACCDNKGLCSPRTSSSSSSGGGKSGNHGAQQSSTAMFIQGYEIYFPAGRKPFPAQVAVMSKVLQAAKESKNALLESPTGTGKTLALLSSTLAFQRASRIQSEKETARLMSSPTSSKLLQEFMAAEPVSVGINRFKIKKQEMKAGPSSPFGMVGDVKAAQALFAQVPKVPKVYYATRTHSQLKQISEELQRCHPIYTKDISMAVLGSRQHFCSNSVVRKLADRNQMGVDEICQDLLSKRKKAGDKSDVIDDCYPPSLQHGCPFMNEKRIAHVAVEVQKTLHPPVWDIEALDQIAKKHKGCAYLTMRLLAKDANYILCPYNYLIHPSIRQAMGIDLQDAIVVFDEAHNIEDVAREAGSLDTTLNQVVTCLGELQRLGGKLQSIPAKQLSQLILHLQHFMEDMLNAGTAAGAGGFLPEHPVNNASETPSTKSTASNKSSTDYKGYGGGEDDLVWEGGEFADILDSRYQINAASLAVYQEFFKQFLEQQADIDDQFAMMQSGEGMTQEEAEMDEEDDGPQFPDPDKDLESNDQLGDLKKKKKKQVLISIGSLSLIRNLLSVLQYLLKGDKKYVDDFRVVLQQLEDNDYNNNYSAKKSKKKQSHLDLITLHIWCLNAGVVFQDITSQAKSVLLSSGTLSPLDSFAGELATSFPIRVEANHVINLSQQLIVGCISTLQDRSLSSLYSAQQSDGYLDMLGQVLYLVMRQVPGGVLMFVPSYALLHRLVARWTQLDPFGSEKKTTKKRAFDKKTAQNELDVENGSFLHKLQQDLQAQVYFEPKESSVMPNMLQDYYRRLDQAKEQHVGHSTAAMIAVCRGKVSEGINFSDHYARAVIIIGIPYPSVADKKVDLKRKYQDRKATSKSHTTLFPPDQDAHSAVAEAAMRHADGATWYKQQAFRAINQAIGRCIRHKDDYGAILLVDPRYSQNINHPQLSIISQLSKWLRSEAKVFDRLEDILLPLRLFFQSCNSSLVSSTLPTSAAKAKADLVKQQGDSLEKQDAEDMPPPPKKKQINISISQAFRKIKASNMSSSAHPFTVGASIDNTEEENQEEGSDDEHADHEEEGEEEEGKDVSYFIDRGNGKVLLSPPLATSPLFQPHSSTKKASQRLFQDLNDDDIKDEDLLHIQLDYPELESPKLSVDAFFQKEKIQVLQDPLQRPLIVDLPSNLQYLTLAFHHGLQYQPTSKEYLLTKDTIGSTVAMQVLQMSSLPATINETGYKIVDQWQAADGVVYRLLLEETDRHLQLWSVLVANVIASSSKIHCLQVLDQCYGSLSLMNLLRDSLPSFAAINQAPTSSGTMQGSNAIGKPTLGTSAGPQDDMDYVAGPFSTSSRPPSTNSSSSKVSSEPSSDNIADYYSSSYFHNK